MGAGTTGGSQVFDVGWRVLMIAVVYAVLFLALSLGSGSRPSVQTVVVGLATGAGFALVLLPLARRLPYRMWTRLIALFVPLYWIYSLSNLVEAYFITSYSHTTLVLGAVFSIIPALVVSWLVAWLLPAYEQDPHVPGIWDLLSQRLLLSWAWRIVLAGLLFAVLLNLFGVAWGPLISRYYHDPAYVAQAHIANPLPPSYVTWAEEYARGVVFVLALLPVLAVVRGRGWPAILGVAAYVALIDAALEGWLTMLGSAFPVGFRLGEGLDLTSDAVARGIFVAALLAMPALASQPPARPGPGVGGGYA
jgi:hypothetical protein